MSKSCSLFIVILAFVAAGVVTAQQNVIEVGDSEFQSTLDDADTALVMFYAPWCGHCKRLKPEFEKAAGDLIKNDPPVSLIKVDCTEAGKDSCGRFDVRGYPTLKIFRNGEFSSDYNGPREAAGITKYMQAQVGPASKELEDEDEVKEFLNKKTDVVVVAYLENESDRTIFQKVANKMRENVAFAHVKKVGGKYSGVVLHRPAHLATKLEESNLVYDDKMDKDDLSAWITKNYHGLVGVRTTDNLKDFHLPLLVAYYDVDYVKNPKGTNYYRNRVMKIAKKYPEINFAVSNKEDFLQELAEYGMDTPSTPDQKAPKIAIRDEKGLKYVMSEEFSMETLDAFVVDFKAGKLESYVKSEEVPDNTGKDVLVAVGKNFEELVTKEKEKDILLEFYAPWCGHCKKLAPIFDELGEKMKDEDVKIIKMDATANDVPPEFQVRGFPTLYWIPAGKKPVSYEGGRELKDFINYISEHATYELKGYNRKGKPQKEEL